MQVHPSPVHGAGFLNEPLRSLQQAATQALEEVKPANITFVNSPQALSNAVQAGALDIVVTEHLDLTTLPLLPTSICTIGCDSPLGSLRKTRPIRVSFLGWPRLSQEPNNIAMLE